ncbi:MAG: hypothetical protein MRJ65_02640 [Candidatus Brocadiaceae bacterium]|nr:hypothetical protein [Candidatus Brocadiaceae bacterium]
MNSEVSANWYDNPVRLFCLKRFERCPENRSVCSKLEMKSMGIALIPLIKGGRNTCFLGGRSLVAPWLS